ncbi:Transposase family Tnp2 protein [Ceratobasidium theobromae]|uniref:Transposase family Tnp2 protein n=1 Tax=Ceratobasidium theobromae TaxID=1582974 RepID=A0A5N5Q6P9_9AGAM|nr:Transposase family Tnp2 protein [Ceratobasidium theobromae]
MELVKEQMAAEKNEGAQHNNTNMNRNNNNEHDESMEPIIGPSLDTQNDMAVDNPPIQPYVATHGLLHRNPPVEIMDWPGPDLNPEASDDDESPSFPDELPGSSTYIPEYSEHTLPLSLDPVDEPELTNDQIQQLLHEDLGDFASEEWINMYTNQLVPKDFNTLRFLATC